MEMKKYFGLLFCLIALNACDDGDMVFESLSFNSEASAADCGSSSTINSVFKIDGSEALILKIDGNETINNLDVKTFPFRNQETAEGASKIFKINSQNRVIYRVFNDAVSATYFCQDIPPISPTVITESTTLNNGDGRIEIKTRKLVPENETPYASASAIKYRHTITLRNITFSNSQGSTIYEKYEYGYYDKTSGVSFPFVTAGTIIKCSGTNLFRFADKNPSNDTRIENLNEVLEFTMTDDEFAALSNGETQNLYLSDTNKLIYKIYNSDVSPTFLCGNPDPTLIPTPVAYETFVSENGVAAVGDIAATGVIAIRKVPIVPQTGSTPQFTYEINFRNITFKDQNGATRFKQGNITFGNYVSY